MKSASMPLLSSLHQTKEGVPLHPIIISILFHHYKELKECMSEVERIEEERVNNSKKKQWLTIKEEEDFVSYIMLLV